MKLGIDQILTLTTGRLYTKNGIAGVYETLDGLLNEKLMTHHLPVANDFCKPQVEAQLPVELLVIVSNWNHSEDWQKRICEIQDLFGSIDITIDKTGFEDYMIDNSLLIKKVTA